MPKALLSCIALSVLLAISGAGCGLMDPTYTPNVTAQQNAIAQLRKDKQETAAESAALKAQVTALQGQLPALQSAAASKETELAAVRAQLALAQNTAGTPPEVTAKLASLVSSVEMEIAANRGAVTNINALIADTNDLRAAMAARHKQLAAEENAKQADLKSYKINAAANVGTAGLSAAEKMGLIGGVTATGLAALASLLKSFLGKSRAAPQIEATAKAVETTKAEVSQLWDLIAAAREQVAASTGKALPMPPAIQPMGIHPVI